MADQPLEEDSAYLEDTSSKPTSAHYQARKQKDVPQYVKRHGLIAKYLVRPANRFHQQDQESDELGANFDDQILPEVSGKVWTDRRELRWVPIHRGTGLQYSLNKKKRWEMGDFIKDNLESLNEEDGVQVSLVKGEHRLPVNTQPLQVTEYHTVEDGKQVHRAPNKSYANYESLSCKQGLQRKRGRKGQRPDPAAIEAHDNAPDNHDIHIRYDIFEGSKSRNLYEYYREMQSKQSNSMQTVRKRHNLIDDGSDALDEEQSMDYDDIYGFEDEEDEYYSAPENGECEDTSFTPSLRSGSVLDFLALPVQPNVERKSKRKARLSLKVSAENNSEDHKKSHVVYIGTHKTPSPSIFIGDSPLSRAPMKFSQKTYFNMVPTLFYIPKVELTSQWLVDRFGDAYLECAMLQRRFFIDISAETRKKLEASYGDSFLDKQNFSALCIFEVMKVSGVHADLSESIPVRVYLNADLCDEVRSLSCNTLQPDAQVSIPEVLEAAVKAFEILPMDNFRADKEVSFQGPVAAKSKNPNPLLPTAVTTYTDEHAMEAILRVDNHIKHLQRQLTAVRNFEEDEEPIDVLDLVEDFEHLCGICYAYVDVSHGGGTNLMALAQCQHWFCPDCWTIHISTAIQNGQIPVRCPEYDCKAMLDFDTLRSVVALPLCRMYAAQLRDTFIQKHGKEWKWCPNKHCGRVVHIKDGDQEAASVLACYCGHTWCPECTETPHWPTTCQQAANYIHKLTVNGHLSVKGSGALGQRLTNVHVKRCPSCRTPFQKGYGCLHITCKCRAQFCWGCLRPWGSAFDHNPCAAEEGLFDEDVTSENKHTNEHYQRVELIDVVKGNKGTMRDEWYMRCVAHRYARNSGKIRPLRKMLDSLLSSYKQCCSILGVAPPRSETGIKPSFDRDQMNEVHDIKKRIWNSLNQAHQFAENSLVWLYYTPQLTKIQKRSVMSCIDRLNLLTQIVEQDITGNKLNRLTRDLNGLEGRTMDLINVVKGLKRVITEKPAVAEDDEAMDEGLKINDDPNEPSTSAAADAGT